MIFSIFYVVVFAHADFYMHINVSLMYACGFHGNDSSLFFFFSTASAIKVKLFFFFSRTSLPSPMFSRNDFSIWSILRKCIGMVS